MIEWSQLIGIVAFALNVWGNLELTKQTNRGHIIRLAANACWIVYSPLVGAWALLGNHVVFAGINVLGYRRWHRIQHDARCSRPACAYIGELLSKAVDRFTAAERDLEVAERDLKAAFEAGQRCTPTADPEVQFDRWMESRR